MALARGGGTNLYSPFDGCPGTVLARGSEPVRQAALQHETYHKEPLTATFYPTGEVTPGRHR